MQTIILAYPPESIDSRDVFLPIAATPPAPEPEPPSHQVATFYRLLVADQRQQRGSLERCADLEAAALWKAQDIAEHGYWSHRDSEGVWPNRRARLGGCRLPSYYADDANYIESLVAGSSNANVMFAALASSPSHRTHLLGLNDFYKRQDKMGVAMASNPDSLYGCYWVIWIAICE